MRIYRVLDRSGFNVFNICSRLNMPDVSLLDAANGQFLLPREPDAFHLARNFHSKRSVSHNT